MTSANLEIVRAAYAPGPITMERVEAGLPLIDADIEWEGVEADGVFRGRDGYLRAWERWLDAWDEYEIEAEQIIDAGDHVFVAQLERGIGKGSRVPVENRYFSVFTLRAGKILRFRQFTSKAEALEAAGLSGEDTPDPS